MLKRNILLISILAAVLVGGIAGNAPADFTIEAGETYVLTAGETLTVDGNLTIVATGSLGASAGSTNISLSGDWSRSGTFTPGDGTVTFTDSGTVSNITGDNTFNDFTCITASKQLTFQAGSTQTISNTLTLNSQAADSKIVLCSSAPGTRWNFNLPGAAQTVYYVDVQDSEASTNDITAITSENSGNNDDPESSPHWVFSETVAISTPVEGRVGGRQPTIIGTGAAGSEVKIFALVGGVST